MGAIYIGDRTDLPVLSIALSKVDWSSELLGVERETDAAVVRLNAIVKHVLSKGRQRKYTCFWMTACEVGCFNRAFKAMKRNPAANNWRHFEQYYGTAMVHYST